MPKRMTPEELQQCQVWAFPSFGNRPRTHPIRSAQAVAEEAAQQRAAQQARHDRITQAAQRAQAAAAKTAEAAAQAALDNANASPVPPPLTPDQQVLVRAHQDGYADGYSAGARRGMADGMAHARRTAGRLQALARSFDVALRAACERGDSFVVAWPDEVHGNEPETETVGRAAAPRSLIPRRLMVSPTDLPLAELHLAPGLQPLGWTVGADPSIAEGDCAVQAMPDDDVFATPSLKQA